MRWFVLVVGSEGYGLDGRVKRDLAAEATVRRDACLATAIAADPCVVVTYDVGHGAIEWATADGPGPADVTMTLQVREEPRAFDPLAGGALAESGPRFPVIDPLRDYPDRWCDLAICQEKPEYAPARRTPLTALRLYELLAWLGRTHPGTLEELSFFGWTPDGLRADVVLVHDHRIDPVASDLSLRRWTRSGGLQDDVRAAFAPDAGTRLWCDVTLPLDPTDGLFFHVKYRTAAIPDTTVFPLDMDPLFAADICRGAPAWPPLVLETRVKRYSVPFGMLRAFYLSSLLRGFAWHWAVVTARPCFAPWMFGGPSIRAADGLLVQDTTRATRQYAFATQHLGLLPDPESRGYVGYHAGLTVPTPPPAGAGLPGLVPPP